MPLVAGTKLGPYEIQSALGAGGMGEVYKARDTRLERTVAVKVLPSHLSSNPGLQQRFEREAKAISSLQHPHICTLYDVGHQDGTDYLVMELLEGESLAERLVRGPLPLKQALEYGVQVAEALDRAHRAGIVHRDLKPGNIMLTKAGAKLLDFGLAKPTSAMVASASHTQATMAKPLTAEGTIVGTYQYMSPEQVQGEDADARSDIFALGAVLYEMVTGKRAFPGKSQISVMSAILEKDPEPIATVQPLSPPALDHVIRRALEKEPDRRWQTGSDFAAELRWISEGGSQVSAILPLPLRRKQRERLAWAAAGVLALALVAMVAVQRFGKNAATHPIRTSISAPTETSFQFVGDNAGPPVISPDGTKIAFVARGSDGVSQVWVRPIDSLSAHALPGTDNAIFPFWSPDSRSLGFFGLDKLETIDVSGGSPLAVCPSALARGGTWAPDGTILFAADTTSAIVRVPASGGTPAPVTKLDSARHTSHRWPYVLPDGKHFLYLAINHDPSASANDELHFASLDGKQDRVVMRSMADAVYADGYLLFARGADLMAQAFDPVKGVLSGEPQRVGDTVISDPTTWKSDISVAAAGLLIYGSGTQGTPKLVYLDRAGKVMATLPADAQGLTTLIPSPDGKRLVANIDQGANDLWVVDLERGVRTRLTFGPVANIQPVWSPDGKSIVYASIRNAHAQLYRRNADGSGAEEQVYGDDVDTFPSGWSPDGKNLLVTRSNARFSEIWLLPLGGERKLTKLIGGNFKAYYADVSANGRWMAYISDESGRPELYLTSFPTAQGKWQLSNNTALGFAWRNDGKEISFATSLGDIVALPLNLTGSAPQIGAPQVLFHSPSQVMGPMPDAQRFIASVAPPSPQAIVVVDHWTTELKK